MVYRQLYGGLILVLYLIMHLCKVGRHKKGRRFQQLLVQYHLWNDELSIDVDANGCFASCAEIRRTDE